VNKLYLSQQVILILTSCFCNPIIINTFVVFVRLYWFEKRFQGVVTQARATRGRTIPRRRSEDFTQHDVDREERGFGARENGVLPTSIYAHDFTPKVEKEAMNLDSDQSSPGGHTDHHEGNGMTKTATNTSTALSPTSSRPFHRDIMFADEVSKPKQEIANEDRIPEQRTKEEHIAFVESQRKNEDTPTLFIPGPRDVERGAKPQRIDEESSSDNDGADSIGGPIKRQDTEVEPMREEEPPRHIGQRIKNVLAKIKEGDEDGESSGLRDRFASRTRSIGRHLSHDKRDIDPLPYLSYAATIGRNSTFVDLTEEQREELGGIEYRALKTLAWILMCYYIGTFIVAFIIMVPWIVRSDPGYADVIREDGQSPVWWGFFTPMSMFTDLGFTLNPDSMISFQRAVLPLLLGVYLIIAGNTGFPCLLRLIIWIASKCVPYGSGIWEELRFLLDHPRRCFTLLFPRKATWWLFGILIILNGVDLIFFIILDLHDETVTSLPPGIQFLDGLFQAASTRTAGFAVVSLSALHPAIQVSYMVMMYISIFPIAISVRKTNVYEEKSLGVYGSAEDDANGDPEKTSYLSNHVRRQLSFDLWYVFLGLFLITIVEGTRVGDEKDVSFNIFSLLFEIVSAYGTVGLSLGYPGVDTSFSGQFKTLSKLIIIAMMLRGRHRGLPYALDRAILLPSESLQKKEKAMDIARRERRASMASVQRTPFSDHDAPPRLGELNTKTDASRKSVRDRSRHGIKRVLTGALSPGSTLKHHHH
jgi:Trk-type K+ transport system membrane component